MKRLGVGKGKATGMTLKGEEGGWGCGRKKLRQTEEVRLRELLLMTAVSIVRHSQGSDRHNPFLCKSPFRWSLSNSFSTTPLPSLLL